MGMREKLLTGELYACDDDSVAAEQATWLEKVYEYNMTRPSEPEKRKAMLKSMFAHLGKGCYIEPPFHANWGGKNVSFGDYVYANFNLTLVDDGVITVRDRRHRRAPRASRAPRENLSVQHARAHRQKLLAGRARRSAPRRDNRR